MLEGWRATKIVEVPVPESSHSRGQCHQATHCRLSWGPKRQGQGLHPRSSHFHWELQEMNSSEERKGKT